LLGSIVTILYLLDRLGIDIGGLNPFYWYRRRAFAKKYGSDPIYSVEDPIHIAALLVIGAAKLDGDLTAQEKSSAREQFENVFSLDARGASDLFGSAAHLLAAPQLLEEQLQKLADRSASRLSPGQTESLVDMMTTVIAADGEPTAMQSAFVEDVRSRLTKPATKEGSWS